VKCKLQLKEFSKVYNIGMRTLNDTILNFLDIETTGSNHRRDKIIEIYISKVLNGEVISEFHKLINPGFRPNEFILQLTGINNSDLENAPFFEDIVHELNEFLEDGIILAHNARFDYSFIRNHLRNFDYDLANSYCCTVKLSRKLYPQYRSHRLDKIIERIGFDAGDRHRAQYDTEVIREFFFKALLDHGEEKFLDAVNKSMREASTPSHLKNFQIENIPETPGVYLFYGDENLPLYIGMSKNLKQRIRDHFYSDLINVKDFNINKQLKRIETIPTAGILGASIREAFLIKKYQPLYNRMLRRNRNFVKLEKYTNENGYLCVRMNSDNDFHIEGIENIFGVFKGKKEVKEILSGFVRAHGLCPRLLDLENGSGACFSHQLGHCKGACISTIEADEYNRIFDKAFEKIRIQNWPAESEITIREENEDREEELTFNKWAFVNSSDKEFLLEDFADQQFDPDIYSILRRWLGG